jgi:hypothetical protein
MTDDHGRSVHNTRIERLWYDITHGFGKRWKDFFYDLEVNHELDMNNVAHIWLLHYVFLPAINADVQAWVGAWNSHVVEVRGEAHRSPNDRFFFGMLEDGLRGVEPKDEVIEDPALYGIDWEAIEDPQLFSHYLEQNPQDWEEQSPFTHPGRADSNPFNNSRPVEMSSVSVEDPDCPFSPSELAVLGRALAAETDSGSADLNTRKRTWMVALLYCRQLCEHRGEQF